MFRPAIGLGIRNVVWSRLAPETQALVARMSTSPSAARVSLIDALIKTLLANGIWSKLDLLYIMAAHDAQAARLNWVSSSYTLTAVNSPTFATDRGYTGATSTYLATGYNPNTNGVRFTQNSAHLGSWGLTNRADANIISGGVSMATNLQCAVAPRIATNVTWINVNDAGTALGSVTRSDGLTLGSRLSSGSRSNYRDGVLLGTASTASITVPSVPLDLLCWSINGGASRTYWCTDQIAVWTMGAGLSSSEQLAYYNALLAYLQGVGAVA